MKPRYDIRYGIRHDTNTKIHEVSDVCQYRIRIQHEYVVLFEVCGLQHEIKKKKKIEIQHFSCGE